jgi:hypothetical protein
MIHQDDLKAFKMEADPKKKKHPEINDERFSERTKDWSVLVSGDQSIPIELACIREGMQIDLKLAEDMWHLREGFVRGYVKQLMQDKANKRISTAMVLVSHTSVRKGKSSRVVFITGSTVAPGYTLV